MFDYFWKTLEKVLDALLEPFRLRVRTWIKDLSWQGHTLLLVLAGLVALAARAAVVGLRPAGRFFVRLASFADRDL